MEVFAWAGDPTTFIRPCVDGCRKTGSFCEGSNNMCFARHRVPSEIWANGQRTPLCSACCSQREECHFCRKVHLCAPFKWPKNKSSTVTVSLGPRAGNRETVPDGMELTEMEHTRLGCGLDKDGNVDMAAVAVHDLVAKKLAQKGLLMQVFSLGKSWRRSPRVLRSYVSP